MNILKTCYEIRAPGDGPRLHRLNMPLGTSFKSLPATTVAVTSFLQHLFFLAVLSFNIFEFDINYLYLIKLCKHQSYHSTT